MIIAQIGTYPLDVNFVKGGIEASIYGLSSALKEENEIFIFDTPRNSFENDFVEIIEGITVYRYFGEKNNYNSLKRVDKIIDDILKVAPKICHIHGSGYLQNKLFKELKRRKLNTIVTVHGLQYIEKKKELFKTKTLKSLFKYVMLSKNEFEIIENSNNIIVDTKYVGEKIIEYKKRGKINKIPSISIIPQGINSKFFSLNTDSNSKENILLCVGAISQRKSQIKLVECFHKVLDANPNAKLIIAGFISEQEYYINLLKEIKTRNLENHVEIHTENTQEDIYHLFSKSKLFVLYSEEESQGIVLAEAMAVGLPVVATNVGGIPHVIENKINGFLSDYDNSVDFTKNINMLLNDLQLYNKMSQQNIIEAQKYNWKTISTQVLKLYNSLL